MKADLTPQQRLELHEKRLDAIRELQKLAPEDKEAHKAALQRWLNESYEIDGCNLHIEKPTISGPKRGAVKLVIVGEIKKRLTALYTEGMRPRIAAETVTEELNLDRPLSEKTVASFFRRLRESEARDESARVSDS